MTTDQDHDVSADLSGVYLKRTDVEDKPLSLTIASVDQVTFESKNGRPAETKWCLTFDGDPPRKLTLNKTNLQLVARAFGKRTGEWLGKTVTIFWDPSVFFGGQLVGGLRVRIQQSRVRTAAAAKPEDPDDPIPF